MNHGALRDMMLWRPPKGRQHEFAMSALSRRERTRPQILGSGEMPFRPFGKHLITTNFRRLGHNRAFAAASRRPTVAVWRPKFAESFGVAGQAWSARKMGQPI